MADITSTTEYAARVNRVAMAEFLLHAAPLCVYFNGSKAGKLVSHAGSFTVLWQRVGELTPTTTALTELTGTLAMPTRTGTQQSITNVTATVAKYGAHLVINEEVDLTYPTALTMELMMSLGIQAGRSVNRLHRNV